MACLRKTHSRRFRCRVHLTVPSLFDPTPHSPRFSELRPAAPERERGCLSARNTTFGTNLVNTIAFNKDSFWNVWLVTHRPYLPLPCNSEPCDVTSKEGRRRHTTRAFIASAVMPGTRAKVKFSKDLSGLGKRNDLYFVFKPQTTKYFF